MGPSVALDPSWDSRALLPAGALRRWAGGYDGWQKEKEEEQAGDACQPACARACSAAYHRGAARAIAHGAATVGADGHANNGRDRSDGPNGRAHDGRDRHPGDANGYSYSVRDASDAGCRWIRNAGVSSDGWRRLRDAGNAGDGWVWNAGVARNGWRRFRDAGVAPGALSSSWPQRVGRVLQYLLRRRPSDRNTNANHSNKLRVRTHRDVKNQSMYWSSIFVCPVV